VSIRDADETERTLAAFARSPNSGLIVTPTVSVHRDLIITLVARYKLGAVAGLVGIEDGVVSGVINLESSGVEAPDWRPRHDKQYHEA